MRRAGAAGLLVLWAALAATSATGAVATDFDPSRDYHSYANTAAFRAEHLSLDLQVDFSAQRLIGTAELRFQRLDANARALTLDTDNLDIRRVSIVAGGKLRRTPYVLAARDALLGSALRISVPAATAGETTLTLRIAYRTARSASGLQWLAPRQTAGRKHPFLYSQSQSLHARSWVPLQDTPQVRITFDARIRTPHELRAVMGAANAPDAPLNGDYRFQMRQPIPSYLLALGVGDLVFRRTGPRTGVYVELPLAAAAAAEFADTEAMVAAAEKLFGPYRWERYDLLLLPPGFPYGGMENPRLSFITPTLIAGDRSLVAVIAHELAHSWSGNLVTNATWGDFWLNEGCTVFLESQIVGSVYGDDRQQQEDVLGWQKLQRLLATLPPEEQILARDLRGIDPDDYSELPYEKGRSFLVFLQSRFGQQRFAEFLHLYFEHFAFQSLTTPDFLRFLATELLQKQPGRVTQAEIEAWLYQPGLPASAVEPHSEAFTRVDEARESWLGGALAARDLPVAGWSTQQWRHFLDSLPPLDPARLAELDAAFQLTQATNAEIAFSWLKQAVIDNYQPAYPRLAEYLQTIGRRKLIKPLYEELVRTPAGTAFAQRIYAIARPGYQSIVQTGLDPIVNPPR